MAYISLVDLFPEAKESFQELGWSKGMVELAAGG
jgi:hypothetical protein